MDDETIRQVRLSDAIGQVRAELERAIEVGKDSPVAFRAGPVELEFQVAFEATASVDAGVRVWVLSAGTKGEATRSTSHRLKVTLTPADRQGKDALVGSVGSR
jgi:Trypsin-co-occurring domain 2